MTRPTSSYRLTPPTCSGVTDVVSARAPVGKPLERLLETCFRQLKARPRSLIQLPDPGAGALEHFGRAFLLVRHGTLLVQIARPINRAARRTRFGMPLAPPAPGFPRER